MLRLNTKKPPLMKACSFSGFSRNAVMVGRPSPTHRSAGGLDRGYRGHGAVLLVKINRLVDVAVSQSML
jgi:hypothetical protein